MIITTKWGIGDIVWAIMDRQDYDKPIRSRGETTFAHTIKPCIARVAGINVLIHDNDGQQHEYYTLSFGPDEYSSNTHCGIFATEQECREEFRNKHPVEAGANYEI